MSSNETPIGFTEATLMTEPWSAFWVIVRKLNERALSSDPLANVVRADLEDADLLASSLSAVTSFCEDAQAVITVRAKSAVTKDGDTIYVTYVWASATRPEEDNKYKVVLEFSKEDDGLYHISDSVFDWGM